MWSKNHLNILMILLTIHCLGIIVILFLFVDVVLDTEDVPVFGVDNVRKTTWA